MIEIKYFGHSMWSIKTDKSSVVLDPFEDIGYPMPENLQADIVCSSHNHYDHNNFSLISGNFEKVNTARHFHSDNFDIIGFSAYHDEVHGNKRGNNILYKLTAEGISFLHCGDLGHIPDSEMLQKIGEIDVLMLPIGGTYTLDFKQAHALCALIKPTLILPMHYKTPNVNINIQDYKAFCSLFENVVYLPGNTVTLNNLDFTKQSVYIFNLQENL